MKMKLFIMKFVLVTSTRLMAGTSENISLPTSLGKEIITQPQSTKLLSLKPTEVDKSIYVKVYRKWTIINKASIPVLYCCILLDKEGEAIQANTKPHDRDRFNMLEIGKTYTISAFGFQDARSWMQTVPHPYSLVFGRYTDIQAAPDAGFPSHYFNFVQYSDLYSRVDRKEGMLTDYVGCVQYVTELLDAVKATQETVYWRDICIQNLDGRSVRFTLWNEKARNFNMREYEETEKPTTIAVSSCVVKSYGGIQLSSTAATCYYFNPDIPEANEIRAVYNVFLEPPTILNIQYQRCADIQQEKQRNRVKLIQLLTENPENQKNVRFTVVATLDTISEKMPWFYARCRTCKSKVSDRFPHPHCREPGHDYGYCFKAFVSDDTGSIMITCFSDEAHSIVADCNAVIQQLQDKDPYKIPPELAALQGKTYIFQLHFGKDSTKEARLFFLDKAWDATPPLLPAPETDIKNAATKAETQPEIPTTPVEETTSVSSSTALKDKRKTTTARRPLFQTTKNEPEKPNPKRTKKDD